MGVRSVLLIASLNIFFLFGTEQILGAWFLGIMALQIPLFNSKFHTFFKQIRIWMCMVYSTTSS